MSQQQPGPVGPIEGDQPTGDPSGFPARRDDLLAAAEANQAPDAVLDVLRGLPGDQEFTNTQDVARAAGLGTEERRT